MTPKYKAQELIKKYALFTWKGKEFELEYYKQCALIAVDEIINLDIDVNILDYWYWQEVKQEIEKM